MSSARANPSSSSSPPPPDLPDGPVPHPYSETDDAAPLGSADAVDLAVASKSLLDPIKDARQIVRLIQCQICSGILKEPTTLPCGHSLCKRCVPRTHVRANISWPGTANRLHGFECPFEDCKKEHAVGDCAVDVTLNKVLSVIEASIKLDRDAAELAEAAARISVHDGWDVAGVPSLAGKADESMVLKGGRIVATHSLARLSMLGYECEVSYSFIETRTNDEVDEVDSAVLGRLKEAARTEMDCQVCYALFMDPLTTACGHTFCRGCVHRILDHSDLCPICRRPLSIQAQVNRRSYPPNERLCKMITGFWADLAALRSRAYKLEQQANHGGFDIPIFVCTLSFPRMPTFLHVFEPRYRLMIRRAMEGDKTFGMVLHKMPRAPGEPEFNEFGTLLRIVNIEFFSDGRSVLETVGVSRFRVTGHGWLDGYLVGNIEKVDDIGVAEEEAIEASETTRARGTRSPPAPQDDDPAGAEPEDTQRANSPPSSTSSDDLETLSTRELVEVGVNFVRRMRAKSVNWLTARVLAIYGECPTDPSIFPWWLASILPVRDEEKYRLLGTSSVPTPERCYVDFCLVPVGTAHVSVAEEVAVVQRLLRASGLAHTMHSAGTTVEGSWDSVMRVIGQAHSLVHAKGVVRIQTSMRVGTRTDKKQTAQDKVKRVEDILAASSDS
ncbi:hypothetical protein GGS23DRAFT_606825 [Durotheca rogersii]|uniref:uncharacterized protein n=1 Tax=Durotheca rogersii TaxID=419775 RepID=UPI002220742D|nr:uncharacterized protein GGS23DRAFT_606825 [Durotheca rogersii]KAI5860552.1 hypothetical protein GGS23DRAFT_606825 [Durotheca rogersii]